MSMKKVFVGLGIAVMVVTGLIQSGIFSARFVPTMIGLIVSMISLYLLTRSWGEKFVGLILLTGIAFLFLTHMQWLDPFEEAMNAAVSEAPTKISSSETDGDTSQEAVSGDSGVSKASAQNRSIFDKPEPIVKIITKTKFGNERFCFDDVPAGKYDIEVQDQGLQEYGLHGEVFGKHLSIIKEMDIRYNNLPSSKDVRLKKYGQKTCFDFGLTIYSDVDKTKKIRPTQMTMILKGK